MRFFIKYLSIVIGLLVLFMAETSLAEDDFEVVAAEGSVMVGDDTGTLMKTAQIKRPLAAGKILKTGDTARAVVRVGSDGFIILGKNSQIEVGKKKDQVGFFRQISGIVYYALNSIKSNQRPIEVRTAATTIGIRGTRFIVSDESERNEVGMRKGVVSIASNEGEFEIHKKSQQDEFDSFKQEGVAAIAKEQHEFNEYNSKNQKEFIEYKREFSLEANRMASFDGKKVLDRPLSGEIQRSMESFENYAAEWLKTVRD